MGKRILWIIVCLTAWVNGILAEDRIYVPNFSISAGETKDVSVLMDNGAPYVAFQFDLYLPDGITLTGYEVNKNRVPESTEVSMAEQKNGSYRFIAAALSMEDIEGNSGGIITLTLTAKSNISIANKTGYLRNVKMSTADATGVTIAEVPFTVKILEPSIVTARSYTREYGEENPTFGFDVAGGELEGKPIISCEATATSPVGTYPIVISKGSVTNYNDSYVNGTLTITKAKLTVTAQNYTIKEGDALPTFDVAYTGFKNGETANVLTKKPTITCAATSSNALGTYEIMASGAEAKNYDINYVAGTLTIAEQESYMLRYVVDGEIYKTYPVKHKAAITAEEEPTKEGYTFSGWSTIPATMPAKDVTITGSFIVNKYKLTYKVDGDTYKSFDVEYGKNINPEAEPTKEGYTFSGWSLIPATMPAKDVTVTGAFTKGQYKLTYLVDGQTYKTVSMDYGTLIIPESEPAKDGYTFSGWKDVPSKMPAKDTTITGSFTINRYKLIYMVDGEQYKSVQVNYGTTITAEAEPTMEGYTFSGWSEIPTIMPAKDVIVSGSFTVNKYKLTYKVDGDAYKSFEIEYGKSISPEAEPVKEGYTFSGWSLIPATMPAKDLIVTGAFTINKYKLTYMVDGEEYKSEQVNYGAAITPEAEPVKEGYTFSGWSLIPATMPAKDVTITGSFTKGQYKLTYLVDGQTYKTVSMDYGTLIIPESEPAKDGYTFSGWKDVPSKMPAKDVTVTGSFTINKYTLTYKVDGSIYKIINVNYGTNIVPEEEPAKEGYTFSGWDKIPTTMPAQDVEVTGLFTINGYKLIYIVDGEQYKSEQVNYGAAITPEAEPTKEGYTFSGWSLIPATMPAKDVTITGSFIKGQYKLTYLVDGQTYKTVSMDFGAPIIVEKYPTREGYTFSGWDEIPSSMPAKDVIVTGAFTINKYKLTYMVDGEEYKSEQVNYGAAITPEAEPTKEGYTFSGWSLIPATMPAKDVTITGSFTKGQYKLTYLVDGQTYKTVSMDYGTLIIPESEPAKDGYTFSGWKDVPSKMPAKDTTITGSFTINRYKLIYMVDGEQYKSVQVNYGTTITAEAEPTMEGYTFSGWSEIPTTMPAKDVIVSGSFTVNKYKLTYKVDGDAYKSFEIEYGKSISPEAEPVKEGYTFSGWSLIPATMPAKDLIVTGAFTINKYKLTYMVDGEEYKSEQVNYGAAITPEAEPVKEGYTFSGWSLIPATMPAKDVTITGSFTKGQYKLTYLVDDQTYKTVSMDFGTPIIAEEYPTKEGYNFSGWDEIPSSMPAKDLIVTGAFTINKYKLTYMVDGEEYKSEQVNYGATITPEVVPTKEGYSFSGWNLIPATMPAKDVTITGTFTVNNYKLTYLVGGERYKSVQVDYGTTIIAEPEPKMEGHSFSGWTEIPPTMPAKDVTVMGAFIINTYTLTYKVDGDTYKTFNIEYEKSFTPEEEPLKEGYTFSGWSLIPETMPAKDVTITGIFNVNNYKLIYMVDGEEYKTINVEYGAGITPEAEPIKEGYEFSGWSLIPETMPAHDVTITGAFTFVDAIEGVIADDGEYRIYTLDGKQVETLQKGVNIIKYKNGGTQKIHVK